MLGARTEFFEMHEKLFSEIGHLPAPWAPLSNAALQQMATLFYEARGDMQAQLERSLIVFGARINQCGR